MEITLNIVDNIADVDIAARRYGGVNAILLIGHFSILRNFVKKNAQK